MTGFDRLRQILFGLALFAALALLVWAQQQRIKVADSATHRAEEREATANEAAERYRLNADTLRKTLKDERQAQAYLRDTHNQLRQSLASRQRQIEELKREIKNCRTGLFSLCLTWLGGCASAPPSLAPTLIVSGCPAVVPCQLPATQPSTNGVLLDDQDSIESAWAECAAQVDMIYQAQQTHHE